MTPGRNTPCPCGSGQKFKACCGQLRAPLPARARHEPSELDIASRVELETLLSLLNAQRFLDLENQARAVLETRPQWGYVWQMLGVALASQGKDALQATMSAVQYLPDSASASLNLGNALARVGRLEDAAAHYQRALLLEPELPEAHANLGRVLLRLGHYARAEESCRRAVQLQPANAAAHNSLGNALTKLHPEAAIASFRSALALDPKFVEAQLNLATTLRSLGHLEEALQGCHAALGIDATFAPAHVELATTLRVQRLTTESEAACRQALRIAPELAGALAVLAELRADLGQFSEAESLFQRARISDPESVEAWAGHARVRRMTIADSDWLSGAQSLAASGLPPRREMTLRYAIGKYFDDIKDFPNAFLNFQRANELATLSAPAHDRQRLQRAIDLIIHSHDATWLNQHQQRRAAAAERATKHPVFIVGMLRSGSSLAEQILASHPAVFGAGELTFWSSELTSQLDAALASHSRLQIGADSLAAAGESYLQLLDRLAPGKAHVLDKMPTNFFALGLIRAAFPQARIIHMQRHPVDTCLSVYFQHFEAANTYTHNLADLADYYRGYQRLMEHWRTVLPAGELLEVPYEGLVANTAHWTRAMLDFIGLPWNPRCLEFQRTPRTVITASKWQVRQPIDSTSVDRWRRYEKFLGPLLSLVPHAAA